MFGIVVGESLINKGEEGQRDWVFREESLAPMLALVPFKFWM
jgi:hypothetical protein